MRELSLLPLPVHGGEQSCSAGVMLQKKALLPDGIEPVCNANGVTYTSLDAVPGIHKKSNKGSQGPTYFLRESGTADRT